MIKIRKVIPVFTSTFLHLAFFLAFFSRINLSNDLLQPDEIILTLEELSVSDVSNVKSQTAFKQEEIKNEDAKLVKTSSSDNKNDNEQDKPLPKEEKEKVLEEKPKIDQTIKQDKKQEEKVEKKESEFSDVSKKDVVKTEKDKKKDVSQKKEPVITKKDKDKPKGKKSKKMDDESLDSLLNDLQKSSSGKNPSSKNRNVDKGNAKSDAVGNSNYDPSAGLSLSDRDYINNKIAKFWNKIGLENESNYVIEINLKLNLDGSINGMSVVKLTCPENSNCDIIKENAIRALKMSEPFDQLPYAKYDNWSDINIKFTPNSIEN